MNIKKRNSAENVYKTVDVLHMHGLLWPSMKTEFITISPIKKDTVVELEGFISADERKQQFELSKCIVSINTRNC